jgi:nucleoside-diphosphate-sugar epimerase
MNIILLGYSGLIGSYILKDLAKQIKKKKNFKIICVSRTIKYKPFINKKIKYVKWDFLNFSKSRLFFFEKKNIVINCIGKNYANSKNLKEINQIFVKRLCDYIQENKVIAHLIHLGSASVYNATKKNYNVCKNIKENSKIKLDNFYSKSKFEGDKIIKDTQKNNKYFFYTILRITNVFSCAKNSNSFLFIRFLLKKGIWFKCSNNTRYHFIHAMDVASAVSLCVFNPKISRNKIYIVSEDNNQSQLHQIYAKNYKVNLLIISISLRLIKFITRYFFLPKKIQNLFFTISSEINYDNRKIKKELGFKTTNSLKQKII